MTLKYKYGKRYVKSPGNRNTTVELWQGKKRVKVLGRAKSKAQAESLRRSYQLSKPIRMKEVKTRKRRWDVAAQALAKQAIKAGLRKGGKYQISTGNRAATYYDTHGGSKIRSIRERKKTGSKSLAEEIVREMFRLSKQRLHLLQIGYEQFQKYDLTTFKLRILRKGKSDTAKTKKPQSQRSTQKTIRKATRSLAVSRGGRGRKSKRKHSTVKRGKRG